MVERDAASAELAPLAREAVARGLSVIKFAQLAQVSRPTVNQWVKYGRAR
jgi:predicted transcriptional regulator